MGDEDKTKEQLIDELTELRRRNAGLRDRIHDFDKRIKELNCMYAIFHLVDDQEISLEEMLRWIVDLIPGAWE